MNRKADDRDEAGVVLTVNRGGKVRKGLREGDTRFYCWIGAFT
jgi:hypothetical protein